MRKIVGLLGLALALSAPNAARAQEQGYGNPSASTELRWPLEKRGAHGDKVRAAQLLLRARGYRVAVDGRFGFATESAVRSFQKRSKLKVDGVLGTYTWEKLVVPLRRGARGDAVRALQTLLNYQGIVVTRDGVFGAATERALRDWQSQQGYEGSDLTGRAAVEDWGDLMGALEPPGD